MPNKNFCISGLGCSSCFSILKPSGKHSSDKLSSIFMWDLLIGGNFVIILGFSSLENKLCKSSMDELYKKFSIDIFGSKPIMKKYSMNFFEVDNSCFISAFCW